MPTRLSIDVVQDRIETKEIRLKCMKGYWVVMNSL